jgi:DNA-3-methyladenine glycosylase
MVSKSFFEQSALALAPQLLGKIIKKGSCVGRIVEVEAYGTDPASHAYKITPRSAIMRDTYGHWYVYFTYGMHYCVNVTCDKGGIGAVLIRAVEPIEGVELMLQQRGMPRFEECELPSAAQSSEKTGVTLRKTRLPSKLTNGPAKFCEAFDITTKQNGLPLSKDFGIFEPPKFMVYHKLVPESFIGISPRIGISAGKDLPWRFYIKDNPFVSR